MSVTRTRPSFIRPANALHVPQGRSQAPVSSAVKSKTTYIDLTSKDDDKMKYEVRAPQSKASRPILGCAAEANETPSNMASATVPSAGPSHLTTTSTRPLISPAGSSPTRVPPQQIDAPSTLLSSKKARKTVKVDPTSPANYRFRATDAAFKSGVSRDGQKREFNALYFALERRPYVGVKAKEAIVRSNGRLSRLQFTLLPESEVLHVDFSLAEVQKICSEIRSKYPSLGSGTSKPYKDLTRMLKKLWNDKIFPAQLAKCLEPTIEGRQAEDLHIFFDEIIHKRAVAKEPNSQQVLSLEKDPYDKHDGELRDSRLTSLLMARETGNRFGSMRRFENFSNEFRKSIEDRLEVRTVFTNCAGDIATISWVSNDAYIGGTTVHMDAHNQQYNKPGNLVLGFVARGSAELKSYADHRIVRPVVERGENSTEAMRVTQDPWLYTSVVCSDYDPLCGRAYTSSFDCTVKVWKAENSGRSMQCIKTWQHDGPVNFVQASSYEDMDLSFVATAADVPTDAVRIYLVPKDDSEIDRCSHSSFSCSKTWNPDGTPLVTDKWTYFPSAMKWGIEAQVKHLLLVGYSPRSRTGNDHDIPADKLNTGELCLWDALSGVRVNITSTKSQNVFEVLWHPTRPVFVAATSPMGEALKDYKVRTQVRVFALVANNGFSGGLAFSQIKALDCAAADINELTIMPNSLAYFYVTAGCTNGKAYIWDTAAGDKPIQVLSHGPAFEGVTAGDDEDDTGVKFTAWGTSMDRFYTGSSDGVVKVWNIRCSGKKAKGRVILEAAAQISYGVFSPDHLRLVIGDASGRVFVLSVDEDDGKPVKFNQFLLTQDIRRRETAPITPHADPPPPPGMQAETGRRLGRTHLAARRLAYSGNPTVGMVQGVNYPEMGLFNREFHADHDPSQPILACYNNVLQENVKIYSNLPVRTSRLRQVVHSIREDDDGGQTSGVEAARQALLKRHNANCELDLKFENLSLEIRDVLARDGIGQNELLEGPRYPDLEEEDDEAELQKGKVLAEDGNGMPLWV